MRLGLSLAISEPAKSAAVPVVVSSIAPTIGNDRGGTAVTITGSGFAGKVSSDVTVGGAELGSFTVVDDTSITGTTAAHARGAVDVVVGATTSAGAYTYMDALTVANCEFWVRADLGATLVTGTVDTLADQSGTGDSNKDIIASSSGLRPTYYATHASFNNRAAWGTAAGLDQERRLTSNTFTSAIARGYTAYHVLYIPAGAAAKDVYFRLKGGSGTNSAMLYGQAGASKMHAGDGSSDVTFTIAQGTLYIVAVVAKAAGGADVYVNCYGTPTATGGSGTQSCAGVDTGTYSPDNTQYLESEIIIYSGEHDATTRQQLVQGYLGDAYGVSVSS